MHERGWVAAALAVAIATTTTGCAMPYQRDGSAAVVAHRAANGGDTAPMTPNEVSNAALLRTVQQALNDKGFDAGPVDGRWGTPTDYALRRFQLSQRLPPTGDLDSATMAGLGIAMPEAATPVTATQGEGAADVRTTPYGANARALPPDRAAAGTLPAPMTSTGTTPSGMTTPGATSSGATTRPAAGTPPEQNTGTPTRTGTQ